MLPYSVAGRLFSQIDAQFQFQPDKVKSFSSFLRLQNRCKAFQEMVKLINIAIEFSPEYHRHAQLWSPHC